MTQRTEAYVYYRVRHGAEKAAGLAIRDLQSTLMQAHPGLLARWLQKAESDKSQTDTPQTWMEIYVHPQGMSPELLALIEGQFQASDLCQHLLGPRHLELFEPCVWP